MSARRTSRDSPDWVRALALERVRELKRSGWTYREIGRAHGWNNTRARISPARDVDVAFASALNTVAQGLAFYDLYGNLVYRNRWLHQQLERPNGQALAKALVDFLCDARGQLADREIVRDTQVTRIQTKELPPLLQPLRTLSASLVAYDLFGVGPTILVAIDTTPLQLPTPEDVRRRFRLTRTETRIAFYLADGMRTEDIASVLHLPAPVIRQQTERLLAKLGVATRSDVACALTHLPGSADAG
jgi:DNA-binding CsgD family transcriptional regulator